MLDIEVIGIDALVADGPTAVEVEELCALALSSAGIDDGHVAIEFVDAERIRDLNREHRQHGRADRRSVVRRRRERRLDGSEGAR